MAVTLQELDSIKPTSFNTHACRRGEEDATDHRQKEVQYRQLISRAATQRLHSPSLDDLTKTNMSNRSAHTWEAWEMQERRIARNKARIETEMLGIPWTQFVRDVESVTLEVHVLAPTRYKAPPRNTNQNQNQEASTGNEGLAYEFGSSEDLDGDKEWRKRDAAVYKMLRAFGRGRPGG